MILAKDAHKYPFRFTGAVELEFRSADGSFIREIEVDTGSINKQWFYRIADLSIPPGKYLVQAKFTYECGGKKYIAYNHNYVGLPVTPFILNRTNIPLPRPEEFLLGDMHLHSLYTSDHIEYGAPVEAISRSCKGYGFDFAVVTDHTYDMDDMPDDYLHNDPELRKWKQFHKDVETVNADNSGKYAHIIPGQEITVRSRKGENVHMLLVGDGRLFPGTGDSAEKWFRTRSEHSIEEVLSSKQAGSLAGAAHPGVKVPFLEKCFFNRGRWNIDDIHPGIKALQIANGGDDSELRDSLHFWAQCLKAGKRVSVWGGSDAHGNFNYYRQVGLPMWHLAENDRHVLGRNFTGVYAPCGIDSLQKGLAEGNTYISNGPGVKITVNGIFPGGSVEAGMKDVRVEAISSVEFGRMDSVEIIHLREEELVRKEFKSEKNYDLKSHFKLDLPEGFIVCRMKTEKGGFCYSSPIHIM